MPRTNRNNFSFYENLGVDNLRELAIVGGFSSWLDLEIAYPYIFKAKSILELGAGTGRIIDYLSNKGFKGDIVAIEQSASFVEYLNKNHSDKATIIHDDFKTYNFNRKFDVVLWMWSGILDFSEEEQASSIKLIGELSSEKGVLVVDTPRIGFQTFAEHKDPQRLILDTSYGKLECYIPSQEDMQRMGADAGFNKVDVINYKTATDKERTIYILRKK